jgi:alpha-ribazole phosphatase CobZ
MKDKMFGKDIRLITDHDSLILVRENGLMVVGYSRNLSGFRKFKSVICHTLDASNDLNHLMGEESLSKIAFEKSIPTPLAFIPIYSSLSKNKIVTLGPVTTISNAYIPIKSQTKSQPISTIVIIHHALDKELLLKLMMVALQARTMVLCDSGALIKYGQTEDINILIACPLDNHPDKENDLPKLTKDVYNCVKKSTIASMDDLDFSRSVHHFLSDAGIEMEDMVDAGAELLVGVEDRPEIRKRIENQLKKALEDINVISLVIAGIKLEEEYENHKVAGVNVDDDPAYLYTDEVLGMAIANQIAGTKAIFNFKRYDEAKPGVIGKLGPVMDDVCAGLVAGCMSKIFEE